MMKKFTFENIVLVIAFVFTLFIGFSQNKETLSFSLDPKMMIQGDESHNIPEGTLNFIGKFEAQTGQENVGYWIFYVQMEYADFEDIYKRYAVGAGYTFNKLLKFAEFSGSFNIGAIDRFDRIATGFEAVGRVLFPLFKGISIGLVGSLTDRRDIVYQLDPHNPKGHYWQGNTYIELSITLPKI